MRGTKSGGMGCNAFFFVGLVHLRTRPQKKLAGHAYVHPMPQRNSDPPRLENPGFHDESSEYGRYSSSEASNPVRSNQVKYEYQRSKTR